MEVQLTFILDEEVTPDIFARKIAVACWRQGALRSGESVRSDSVTFTCVGTEEIDILGDGRVFAFPKVVESHDE